MEANMESYNDDRFRELANALRERDQALKKVEALEKRIAELAGLNTTTENRKSPKKTFTPEQFAKACGC